MHHTQPQLLAARFPGAVFVGKVDERPSDANFGRGTGGESPPVYRLDTDCVDDMHERCGGLRNVNRRTERGGETVLRCQYQILADCAVPAIVFVLSLDTAQMQIQHQTADHHELPDQNRQQDRRAKGRLPSTPPICRFLKRHILYLHCTTRAESFEPHLLTMNNESLGKPFHHRHTCPCQAMCIAAPNARKVRVTLGF